MGDPEPIFRVLVTLKWEGRRRPCLLQLLFYVYGKIANKRCSIKKNSKRILDPTKNHLLAVSIGSIECIECIESIKSIECIESI